jgi:hypothetical protein
MSNEDVIHQMYADMQRTRENAMRELHRRVNTANPDVFTGRQAYYSNSPRFNQPSFRSQYFNVGEGLMQLAPQETKTLAMKTVPAFHAGVLTGFSQYFGDCKDDLDNLILWGIRINGLPPHGFMDFVGSFSSLALPHPVYFPLAGGAATLGTVDASVGGSSIENIPTVILQATNYHSTQVTLQGRMIGYTFPTAERNDEFANL